jgi:signal peptidase I
MAAVVGLSLIAGVAYLPSAFRELVHTRTFRIVGESMVPALYVDDYVTADTGYYADHPIADGDIIVFRHNGTVLVKRVLAVGGETIEGRDGKLSATAQFCPNPISKPMMNPPYRRRRPSLHGSFLRTKYSSLAIGVREA